MSNSKIKKCKHCGEEYNIRFKTVGYIDECNKCAEELGSDKNTPRLGGILEFSHKTAPVLKIMSLEDAQTIKRKTDRKGGSGIIVGMATRR